MKHYHKIISSKILTAKTLGLSLVGLIALVAGVFLISNPQIGLLAGIKHDKPTVQSATTRAPTPTANPDALTEDIVIERINAQRAAQSLPAFTKNSLLHTAAETKAQDILDKNYWAENAPDGTLPWVHIKNAGYNYTWASMLLSKGFTSSTDTLTAWMNNAPNKRDILSTNLKEAGVSIKQGTLMGENTTLVVVMLGSINTAQGTTNTQSTNTKITDTDPIISCTTQHLGVLSMKKSQCSISFECQINSQWYLYTSRDQCTKDQQAFYANKSYVPPTYNYPTLAPLPTWAPLPTSSAYIPPAQKQDTTALLQQCISNADSQLTAMRMKLRANGAEDSSVMVQAEQTRNQTVAYCQSAYGSN